jgi:hypothetical protein
MPAPDTDTLVLLEFDGGDGSTVFLDATGRSWTPYGDAQMDTAEAKWGASGLFDGSGDYLTTPGSTDFNFGSNVSFTIDFWIKPDNFGASDCFVIGSGTTGDWFLGFQFGANLGWGMVGVAWENTVGASLDSNTWTHYAVVGCTDDTLVFYRNGTSISSTSLINGPTCVNTVYVASQGAGYYLKGWIDELRVSRGRRWTANFTPPEAPYLPKVGGQVIWVGYQRRFADGWDRMLRRMKDLSGPLLPERELMTI